MRKGFLEPIFLAQRPLQEDIRQTECIQRMKCLCRMQGFPLASAS